MEDTEPSIEMGKLNPSDEEEHFWLIKTEMEAIYNLLLVLEELKEKTKSTHIDFGGLRDGMDSNVDSVIHTAMLIKAKLEALDLSNIANRTVSVVYRKGSHVDRSIIGVTNIVRVSLRDMMTEFQALRNRIVLEREEGIKRSLTELHQVFLDMAVLVDAQGEEMDDIELNVAMANGTNAVRKKGWDLVCWVWSVVLILALVCIVATFI